MNTTENEQFQEAKEQLEAEYTACYEKIENYINHSNIRMVNKKNCLFKILDEFLSAQKEDLSLDIVLGQKAKRYTVEVIKDELSDINPIIFIMGGVASMIITIALIIFLRIAIINKMNIALEDFQNLYLGEYELSLITYTLMIFIINKLLFILFFEHLELLKVVRFIIYFSLALLTKNFLFVLFEKLSIDIPFTIYLIMIEISMFIKIFQIVSWRKRKQLDKYVPNFIKNITDVTIDTIDQYKCPDCGREHDYDNPKCPYCNHKYR